MPLIDSDEWKAKSLYLKQLTFHPANPRLPELRGRKSEAEIIREMCSRADVHKIAKAIADKGYLRQDRLIVFREGRVYVVYEGNRRLCALKLLSNWRLAPPDMHRTYKSLSERAVIPKKIAVEEVPSKFHAEVVMYSKHVDASFTVKWDPIQQATFIVSKLEAGETPETLEQLYGLSRENIVDAKAASDLYRMALLAELTPAARELVNDPSKFPYSTVYERLFKPKASRKLLGATINESGLTIAASEEQFLPVLATIMNDAATGKINTRSLNDDNAQKSYVEGLGFQPGLGNLSVSGLESARAREAVPNNSPSAPANPPAAAPRTARTTTKLLPSEIVLQFEHEKLSRLVYEGKKLGTELPHAAACLLRTILEISLSVKLKKLRHYGRIPHASPKHGPSLAEMLDYVNRNPNVLGLDPGGKSALEALISRAVKQSKPQLDRIVHSPEVIAISEEIIAIRELALPLLTKLLHP